MNISVKNIAPSLLMLIGLLANGDGMAQVVTREKALASAVMDAMGGKEVYQRTGYIQWDFFGVRTLTWDVQGSKVRIDYKDGSLTIITALDKLEGSVFKNDVQLTDPDSIAFYLEKGQRIWMNDSYWLVMPFKLLDPGVRLNALGIQTTSDGQEAEVLELTFGNVGATPDNKYLIYIDPGTYRVLQWDYFVKNWEEEPALSCLWTDYKWYGNILLSSGRGAFGKLENIAVLESVPDSIFRK